VVVVTNTGVNALEVLGDRTRTEFAARHCPHDSIERNRERR
jgi:hypothetical protein